MKNQILIFLLLLGSFYKSGAQTLDEYFKIAAEDNPGLQADYKEFEAALERINQVKSLQDPSLSLGYFISPVETRVGPQRARISLSQMFPWFGTLKARGDQAALLAEARYQRFLDSKNKLYLELAQVYYPLYEVKRLQEIEVRNLKILETYKSISLQQFENGRGSMADVLRVDLQIKSAETNLEILNKKENSLISWFNSLLNRPSHEEVTLPDTVRIDSIPALYRLDSLSNNPLVQEMSLRERSEEISQNLAAKEGLPKLGIGLDYVIIGESSNPAMEESGRDAIMPMVTVSLPIFRGRYKSLQNESVLMQESYALRKQEITNSIRADYYKVNFSLIQQLELMYLYKKQVKETQQLLQLIYSAYSNSGSGFEEVLRVQQQLLEFKKMQAKAEAEYLMALAEINYITAKD